MKEIKVELEFENYFLGELKTDRATTKIGLRDEQFAPYELLLGALGSCFYATLRDVLKKKRVDYKSCHISVEGNKRDTVPTTLEKGSLKIVFQDVPQEAEDKCRKACELAEKYCSVYQTLLNVANLKYTVEFK